MGIGIESLFTLSVLIHFTIAIAYVAWRQRLAKKAEDKPAKEEVQDADDGDSVTKNSEAEKPERKEPPPYRLKTTILIAAALIVCVSVAESVAQGFLADGLHKVADDELLADLVFLFTWMVLYQHLSEAVKITVVHFGSFILSILVRSASLGRRSTEPHGSFSSSQQKRAVQGLISVQTICVAIALAIIVVASRLPVRLPEDDPETQPLLQPPAKKKDNVKNREETEDDKARNALRDRPFMQYLKSFKLLVPFMWPNSFLQKARITGMVICSALERVTGVLQPLATGAVVNDLTQTWGIPWKSLTIYIVLRVLSSGVGISMVEDMLYTYVQNEQEIAMKRAVYEHIMDLSANFHDSKTTSHVWQALYQARSAIGLIHDIVFSLGPSVIDLIAGFFVLYVLFGDYMGLLVLSTVVLFLWTTASALAPRADLYRKYEDCWYDETFQMLDSTQNWYTVSEFNQVAHEKVQFREKATASRDINMKIWWYNRRSNLFRQSIITVGFVCACCLAITQIAGGEQKVGAFVTLTAYWAQMQAPLSKLVSDINGVSEKLVRAEKLLVLLEKKPEVEDAEDAKPYEFLGGAVEFENVHFTYDGKRQASEGITFRAQPGTTTALVGETGGGKSTILKLLFRFHDPQKGRVLLDGQDLRDLETTSFRKHIGWVPQDAVPFNKTILDNVRYSNLEIEEAEVQEACKDAALHNKIMEFTKKYQEKVGERGTKLSGGERQRLAIARAILKNPDILLLDEATSAVDSVTEAQIQASLEKLGTAKTTFIIAHRLSTILKADQILVIEKGKLVECGSHADLIKVDGAYKKLWDSQLKLQADMAHKGPSDKSNAAPTTLNLIDDVTKGDDAGGANKQAAEEDTTAKSESRGRKSAKERLKSVGRRLSGSRSSRRSSAHSTIGTVTNGKVSTSLSPTRSKLKADAPEFVPKTVKTTPKDGAEDLIDLQDDKENKGINGTTHDRRLTKSESAVLKVDEQDSKDDDDDDDTENGNGGDNGDANGKYSRIPKRSQ